MNRIYLAVPFVEKDEAKSFGAKWDGECKKWYCEKNNKNYKVLLEKWEINDTPIELIGEDREFGGNTLFIDLVPSTCWFSNVRSCIHPKDWDRDLVRFRNIVEKSLLVENLDFILAVDNYRRNCKKDFIEFSKLLNKNMKKNANECFKHFIEINSDCEVNISSFVRSRIVNHLETWIDDKEFLSVDMIQSLLDDDPYHHINIFEKAYNEISIMLFQNIWIKYISEEIKNSMC
jgi:hypothetical protein